MIVIVNWKSGGLVSYTYVIHLYNHKVGRLWGEETTWSWDDTTQGIYTIWYGLTTKNTDPYIIETPPRQNCLCRPRCILLTSTQKQASHPPRQLQRVGYSCRHCPGTWYIVPCAPYNNIQIANYYLGELVRDDEDDGSITCVSIGFGRP